MGSCGTATAGRGTHGGRIIVRNGPPASGYMLAVLAVLAVTLASLGGETVCADPDALYPDHMLKLQGCLWVCVF